MGKYLEMTRSNFLTVYMILRAREWDATYQYQKLIDIFGGEQMDRYEELFDIHNQDYDNPLDGDNGFMLPTLNLGRLEAIAIKQALEACDWVQYKAARKLGITARALNYKIKQLGLHNARWSKFKDEDAMKELEETGDWMDG